MRLSREIPSRAYWLAGPVCSSKGRFALSVASAQSLKAPSGRSFGLPSINAIKVLKVSSNLHGLSCKLAEENQNSRHTCKRNVLHLSAVGLASYIRRKLSSIIQICNDKSGRVFAG